MLPIDLSDEKKINLIVGEKDQNIRVDIFINKNNQDISRTRVKNLILNKNLKIKILWKFKFPAT